MEYKFNLNNKVYKVKIGETKESYTISIDDKEIGAVKVGAYCNTPLQMVIDGKTIPAYIAFDKDKGYIFVEGNYHTLNLEKGSSGKAKDTATGGAQNFVSSPMPGTLVKVLVSKGDEVTVGQTLAIVEAMKMENELKSQIKGKVKQVNFSEGTQVDAFQPIVELL